MTKVAKLHREYWPVLARAWPGAIVVLPTVLGFPRGTGLLCSTPGLTLLFRGYSRVLELSFGGEAARKGMYPCCFAF